MQIWNNISNCSSAIFFLRKKNKPVTEMWHFLSEYSLLPSTHGWEVSQWYEAQRGIQSFCDPKPDTYQLENKNQVILLLLYRHELCNYNYIVPYQDAFLMLYMKILHNTDKQAMWSLVMFRIGTQEVHNICHEILLKKCRFDIHFDKCISSISG